MERKDYDLELIQKILGHEDEEMTLEYIDPDMNYIDAVFKSLWQGVKLPKFSGEIRINETH